MKIRRPLATLSLTALVLGALAVTTGATASATDVPSQTGSGQAVYTGTATVTVTGYDYCDFSSTAPQPNGRQSYSAPVTLVVSDPIEDPEGGSENNPVHFVLQTDDQVSAGAFSLASATGLTTPDTGRPLTVTYWSVQADGDGSIAATLTDDHVSEAAAYNLFNGPRPLVPCRPELGTLPQLSPIAEGATLQGTLDESAADLEVAGGTSDGFFQIAFSTSLSRTG